MSATVTVYLNDTTDYFTPFDATTAQLREAVSFDTDVVDLADLQGQLRRVFEQLNIDTPTADWAKRYRENRNRSLSVGDVVVIGETAWVVARFGWDQISGADVTAAVERRGLGAHR